MIKHLRCENGFKFTPAEALGYIHLWGKFFSSNVERADDMDALNSAIKFVNGESGIRCVAAEMLVTVYADPLTVKKRCFLARAIADCAMSVGKPQEVEDHLKMLDSFRPGLGEFMRFYIAPGIPFNIYAAQNDFPSVVMLPEAKQNEGQGALPPAATASETLKKCRSQGQRTALAHLSQIACVRHQFGAEICGIPIRAAALLIGLSGSGKTFVAKAFAAASGWPVWEATEVDPKIRTSS